jgi:hypothetical protein
MSLIVRNTVMLDAAKITRENLSTMVRYRSTLNMPFGSTLLPAFNCLLLGKNVGKQIQMGGRFYLPADISFVAEV